MMLKPQKLSLKTLIPFHALVVVVNHLKQTVRSYVHAINTREIVCIVLEDTFDPKPGYQVYGASPLYVSCG